MMRVAVAVMLLAACRDGKTTARKDAGPHGSASAVSAAASVVPKLPLSEDGDVVMRAIDRRIATLASDKSLEAHLLLELVRLRLERAAIRGDLVDYQSSLVESKRLVELAPAHEGARILRFTALMRVHDFAAAREALEHLRHRLSPSRLREYEVALADASGDDDRALAIRQQLATEAPSPESITLLAATLARRERFDEAMVLVAKAAARVRDNPTQLLAWLLFQWGRIHELKGEPASARELYTAARARLPDYVEATAHLAQTMIATTDEAGARKLVDAALAKQRHPELLALAVHLGRSDLLDEARAAWERYVAALPLAFADHAARFYLGVGRDPKRALELARLNHGNRDTREARSLVVEAGLAANDAAAACAIVEPLATAGTRAQKFIAWQALTRCDRREEAERLARALGM